MIQLVFPAASADGSPAELLMRVKPSHLWHIRQAKPRINAPSTVILPGAGMHYMHFPLQHKVNLSLWTNASKKLSTNRADGWLLDCFLPESNPVNIYRSD